MSCRPGRILKARDLAERATQPLRGPSPAPERAQSEVELVEQDGKLEQIEVRCRCGEVHRLNLVEPAEPSTAGEEA